MDRCLRCDRTNVWSRGYCNRCYQHVRKSGELPKIHGKEIPRVLMRGDEDEKPCRVCGLVKKGTEFWNEKKAKDGKQNSCRDCNKVQVARWKKDNPEKRRAIKHRRKEASKWEDRKHKYGITRAEWEAMEMAQGGVCAICGRKPGARGLATDHDHDTGVVRGLLCIRCNAALGSFGDSIEGLQRAIAYLRRADMAGTNIRTVSTSKDVSILKQGHTTNDSFGSSPTRKVKGGRATRDLTIPTAKS